jgi:hypothetical protein
MNKRKNSFFLFLLLAFTLLRAIPLPAQPDGIKLSQPRVFSNSFERGLYKSQLTVHGKLLSGLILIKRTGETFRIVFLSEIGIKYFDIEVGNNEQESFIVHSMLEMLDRKSLTDFIENTFRMLTMSWGTYEEKYTTRCEGSGNWIKVIKTKDYGKFRLDYHPNFGQVSLMWHYGFLKKKLTIDLSDYDYLAPSLVIAKQQKMEFRLLRIEK